MARAPEACILCGSADRTLLFRQDEWTVFKCSGCDLGFLDPRPTADELGRYYERTYFDSHYDKGLRRDSAEMRKRLSQEKHRISFFRPLKPRGRILDIGCGMGYFLYACSLKGYEAEGMDISDVSTAYIRSELGLQVKTGVAGTVDFEEGSFDIVTMWHFLEHSPDPRDYLSSAWKWLKGDGILVVDVPNHEGTDARMRGAGWRDWDLPYHLYHFTPKTLVRLLSLHGFDILRTKHYHSEVVKERLARIPVVGLFARLIAKAYSGGSYAVVAKKNVL
ncbi:MAG TPA: class I SAM-dependent methyltransferase [Syntrophales bacterium]|nr:class I SAM-dependent methyltransferase [Syntrophales bacterium]